MILKQLFTRRLKRGQNYAQAIIYEWEDIIAKELDIPIRDYPYLYKLVNFLDLHIPIIGPIKNTLRFVINGKDYDEPMNHKQIIPCIIDFFEKEDQLQDFYKRHSNNKIVLLSSPFDFNYLKKHNCPINIGLFAYSLSDQYAITNNVLEKKYDIVLTGRQDPLLYSFFKKYVQKHPAVTFVKRGKGLENDNHKTSAYYLNGEEYIGEIETREEFMQLQAQGKATIYGTQGYIQDGYTNGFYHMTPHFLEIIASGCHVLARYPSGDDGIDAQYYEFEKFSPSIETYQEFEEAMDNALKTQINIDEYSTYLKKHYTSVRVSELKRILSTL